ncbi:DUF3990 domain-containing protein [Adlercreutzia sp. R25]|uniref:DUF3990 domain-containing protein n=1 Tax=Adlercreutzia shanghongiae TaxID=3111773 RepID=A0ABU6J1M5_9ACTN|nr:MULTISPECIES: DUF3990 domain-containing protein [unclassified Adlercreutzia]MEC4273334.1 DUF3990 domain-containing protein [Adlercreutzia sp. R25]MEC4295629.1 DUF3990 domain-containing protein [Adlercreutzia sp. R22]
MRVYHASDCVVDSPDTEHSRDNLDFGRGFYVTTMKDQATSYAQRFMRRGRKAYVGEYDLDEGALASLDVLEFSSYDGQWLDFVMACRSGADDTSWDVVMGGIANDRVFTTVDLYFAGEITKEEALGRLAYVNPNDQLCFRTQRAINRALRFCGAEEVS